MERRTIFVVSILFVCASPLSAQDQGFVSGTIAYDSSTEDLEGSDDPKTSTFTFGPVVGYNLSPENVVGLSLNYTGTTDTYFVFDINGESSEATDKENLFVIQPFFRRLKSVGDKCSLYGQLNVGFGFGGMKTEYASSTTEGDLSLFRVGIAPGVVYVFADRWAVNADWGLLQYETRTLKVDDEEMSNDGLSIGVNLGAITFGLNWLF